MYGSKPQIILDVGFDFSWSSRKVWALDLPVETMAITELIWHFGIPFWDSEGTDEYNLTPNDVLAHPEKEPTHFSKIQHADLAFPIDIMENKGRWLILDGLHRLAKAYMLGMTEVQVRKVPRELIPLIVK